MSLYEIVTGEGEINEEVIDDGWYDVGLGFFAAGGNLENSFGGNNLAIGGKALEEPGTAGLVGLSTIVDIIEEFG